MCNPDPFECSCQEGFILGPDGKTCRRKRSIRDGSQFMEYPGQDYRQGRRLFREKKIGEDIFKTNPVNF